LSIIVMMDAVEADRSASPLKNFVAGGVGGLCLLFAGHPKTSPTITKVDEGVIY